MKGTTIGILLLVLLASALIVAWHFLEPLIEERRLGWASDAGKIKEEITLAGDSWLGYFVFRSPEFKKRMREQGTNPIWIDDNAQYQERMQKFAAGEYHFIVATVDSYILNAWQTKPPFPGVIVAIIDESKGGDAIVADGTITDLNDLNRSDIKIALTPASPSEFLMKAVASHFNVHNLNIGTQWKIETDGAKGAFEMLQKSKVPVAVLWEPFVSKALQLPGCHTLLGTEKTSGLIVDIVIAHRNTIDHSPDLVNRFLQTYFQSLSYYQQDPERLVEQAAEDTNESKDGARKMLEGISFIDFNDNCQVWFGLGLTGSPAKERLASTIESTVNILKDNNDLSQDPLQGNPYTIMNSTILENLLSGRSTDLDTKFSERPGPGKTYSPDHDFANLDKPGWNNLKRVGTMKIRPIVFQSSTPILSMSGKEEIDQAAEVIGHYPHFRILIKGHTSPGGDESANHQLSEERARSVRQYLLSVHDVDQDRVMALGVGSQEQLDMAPNESYRAFKLRLQRVEFIFLEDQNKTSS
ncbi:OmpA family protein [bacterium]|nr:OmpA family protein [bacterium]